MRTLFALIGYLLVGAGTLALLAITCLTVVIGSELAIKGTPVEGVMPGYLFLVAVLMIAGVLICLGKTVTRLIKQRIVSGV